MQKNLNIEKIAFKVVQMKFLAMHITNQKLSFDIFKVGNLQNIFMEHNLYLLSLWFFGIKKIHNLTHNVLLAIAYKYTHATYDWFCGPGSHLSFAFLETQSIWNQIVEHCQIVTAS